MKPRRRPRRSTDKKGAGKINPRKFEAFKRRRYGFEEARFDERRREEIFDRA